jgi:predicted dehydrogenase
MRTALICTGARPGWRAETVAQAWNAAGECRGYIDAAEDVDLVFVGVPPARRFETATAALRSGAHVFLEWPPATSIRECAVLVRLAEESGREAAVSRTLRWSLHAPADPWRARVISMETGGAEVLPRALADAVDLAFMLAGSMTVRRAEAEAAYDAKRALTSVAASLRFHNGAFMQALIRSGRRPGGVKLYAAGTGEEMAGAVRADESALHAEAAAVLDALRAHRPVPVSALDAQQTMRVVERIMSRLR